MEITRFENLENLRIDLNLRLSLWKSLQEWKELVAQWKVTAFSNIDAIVMKEKIEMYSKVVMKCSKNMPPNAVMDELRVLVFEYRDTLPVVMAMRNSKLKESYWGELKALIGKPFEI